MLLVVSLFLIVYGLALTLFARTLLPCDPLRRLLVPHALLVTPRAVLVHRLMGAFWLVVGAVLAVVWLVETRD